MIERTGSRRRLRSWLSGSAVVVAALLTGLAGSAFANAPNPASATQATTTTNSNGTVLVKISGTWDWGDVTTQPDEKTSPQQDCTQRYGVGWAVDWQDPTVAPWNNADTLKQFTITKNGASFAAGANYDGFQVGICQQKDADGFPTGPWSAQHTYANASSVPKTLCVNFYDPHGKEGEPAGGVGWPEVNNISPDKRNSNFIAAGPRHDGDNSIETNSYNPAEGGNCATPHPAEVHAAAPSAPQPAPQPAPAPTRVLGTSVARSPVAQPVRGARLTFTG